MKKNSLFIVLSLLSVINLTSCLKGNNTSSYVDIGVLDFNMGNVVMRGTGPAIYSSEINALNNIDSLQIGGCYLFSYTIDWDLIENSESLFATNGFYVATLNGYRPYVKSYISYPLTDTSTIVYNEIPIKDAIFENDTYGYSNGYLFLTHVIERPEDMSVELDVTYDFETMKPTVENGIRYYDFFIRATKKNESQKSHDSYYYSVAYYIRDYLTDAAYNEKNFLTSNNNYDSTSKIRLRFNYAAEINGNIIRWSKKEFSIGIEYFISTLSIY